MFSLVQNITSALKPLGTEAVDARLEKKRYTYEDLPDEDRGALQEEPSGEEGEFATLSIKSVILFLEDFVEARLASRLDPDKAMKHADMAPWFKQEQSNDTKAAQTKQAANAYARAAKTVGRSGRRPQQQIHTTGQAELKNIYGLIKDLRYLNELGVKVLAVHNQMTFLDGVFYAVERLKRESEETV